MTAHTLYLSAAFLILPLPSSTALVDRQHAAGHAEPGATAARAGFERMRGVAGAWSFVAGAEHGRVTYTVVSDGTALLETVTNDEHGEAGMVSVIYVEGDQLVLQHYCSAGNQPRMVSPGLDGDRIRFTLEGITNLTAPSAGHIHEAEFRFPADGTFESRWTWREDGADTMSTRRHAPASADLGTR